MTMEAVGIGRLVLLAVALALTPSMTGVCGNGSRCPPHQSRGGLLPGV
jgi:hypothetical protein